MLLRICLILTILAGLGAIAASLFLVKPRIETIIEERNKFETKMKNEASRAVKAETKGKELQAKLSDTETKLSNTEGKLVEKTQFAVDLEKRAVAVEVELSRAKQVLVEAQRKVSLYELFGPPEQIKAALDSEKKLQLAVEALDEEKKVLLRQNKRLQARVDQIEGRVEEVEPPMPGVKGKILIVDPKWNFVILDVGEKAGALERGVLMVSRNSKLVGKVKIVSVSADRSIANIIPSWKLDELHEGDQVLY
ncbi:MAG TPA: hypothetical protein VGK40_12160 [Verrucomicrobiae bacterium]|jgi:FtsZ-binding cell division protein ZapB